MKRYDVDMEDDEREAERLEDVEEIVCMQVADVSHVERRMEQIEDVDWIQVVDVKWEDEGLKDMDDLECMHILDGDYVKILDVHVQPERDEGIVKDHEVEHVKQDDQANAVVGCKKVLDQKDLDAQEVVEVPSLLEVVARCFEDR